MKKSMNWTYNQQVQGVMNMQCARTHYQDREMCADFFYDALYEYRQRAKLECRRLFLECHWCFIGSATMPVLILANAHSPGS